jgi:senataxin
MHPDISQLPSQLFYQGKLLDGPDMASKTQRPWHTHPKFGPYRFYNVMRGVEMSRSHSYMNHAEVEVAVTLYNRMQQEFGSYNFTVGVVTMYKAQATELRRAFERRFGANIVGLVDFNTVDGFQGQEKDVIILSCVRAGPGVEKVGFLAGEWRVFAPRLMFLPLSSIQMCGE